MARSRHAVLTGYYQALAKADTIEKFVKVMASAALYSEGQKILAASKAIVPKVTGELLASAYIHPPVLYPSGASVELGYSHDSAVSVHFQSTIRKDRRCRSRSKVGAIQIMGHYRPMDVFTRACNGVIRNSSPAYGGGNVSTFARLRVRVAKMRMNYQYEVEHNRHDNWDPHV